MAKVGLYVTRADKAFLDELPPGVTGAAILRAAIRQYRECEHPGLIVVCPGCGFSAPADLDPDEDPALSEPEPEPLRRQNRRSTGSRQ